LWLAGGVSDAPHFTTRLPTKRVAADCLFTNEQGQVLVLEPTYKPTWDLPGGVVEIDESPLRAAQREVEEDLGLVIEPGRLLAVDWQSRVGDYTEVLALLFDGGVLESAQIARIVTDPTEAKSFRFADPEDVAECLDGVQAGRVAAGLKARELHTTMYLEDGHLSS
jgi:ADP-ribose pyrophosphatase YjhB (NUDIX family)